MGDRPPSAGRAGPLIRSPRPRYLVPALVFVLIVIGIVLVVLSPLALDAFGLAVAL